MQLERIRTRAGGIGRVVHNNTNTNMKCNCRKVVRVLRKVVVTVCRVVLVVVSFAGATKNRVSCYCITVLLYCAFSFFRIKNTLLFQPAGDKKVNLRADR